MTRQEVLKRIHSVLAGAGFARHGQTWNRRSGLLIDVVDVQGSRWAAGAATMNLGVFDLDLYEMIWGKAPTEVVRQPECVAMVRIGRLLPEGKDKWWTLDDLETADGMSAALEMYALPFFERLSTREGMRQWFVDTRVERGGDLPPILGLAILESLGGNSVRACEIISDLLRRDLGAWRQPVDEIAARLMCGGPSTSLLSN
jgi:hypothetical protein